MPLSSQVIAVSGIIADIGSTFVYVTYTANQLQYDLPYQNYGNLNAFPMLFLLQASLAYTKDSQGNVLVEAKNADGSYPTL